MNRAKTLLPRRAAPDLVPADVTERATSSSGCRGGSWRCRQSACSRFSAGRWGSWTCGRSESTARSSGRPLHGDLVGDRHTGPETRAGPARRRHRDRCRHPRPAERPGDARDCRRTGRCSSSSMALRGCAGPSPMSSVLAAWCNAAKSTSGGTCSAICRSGCTPLSARRCGMRGTSIWRTVRRGCWTQMAGSLERDHPGAAASIRD